MTSRRMKVAWLAAVAVILAMFALAPAGSAQSSDAPFTQMRGVGHSPDDQADLAFYFAAGSGGGSPSVTLNGNPADVKGAKPVTAGGVVDTGNALVFDTSEAMDKSGALASAKEAARSWITAADATQRFAIYTAADKGNLVQAFTADKSLLLEGLDHVGPPDTEAARSKTALWSAVRQAAGALIDRQELLPNIVIMAGQNDNASGSEKSAAIGDVASAQAAILGVAYTGSGYNGDQLKSLAGTYGGEVLSNSEGTQLATQVSTIATLVSTQTYAVAFQNTVPVGQLVDLQLTAGDQVAKASYTSGTDVFGFQNLNPDVQSSNTKGISFLQGGLGLALAVLLVLVATALAAYAIFLLVTKDNSLNNVLQPYSEGYGPQSELDSEDEGSYAKTALIQRAVEVTENFAESQGYLTRAEGALERANLPLRAGEALFFYGAVVLIATILGLALGGLFVALIFGGFAAMIPPAIVSFLANRRRKTFLAQLPDTLQLLSGTLRAGYSLMQGVEAVSQEVENPMGAELRRVVTESRLGRPLEESLEGVAERMASPDFSWAVMAIRIQREVGGNLSELLLTVADTMTQRERLRRDVAALTAEGRMSAIVLGLLPIGLGAAMFVINPEYTSKLFNDTLGNILLGGAVVMMIIGFVWMKKIIDIEI
jgi:tight adherence protein B